MGKLPNASDSADVSHDTSEGSTTQMLITTMADTTWRMFVPTVGLLLIGNALDDHFHTQPWLMLTGAIIGAAIAALLIKRQLARGTNV